MAARVRQNNGPDSARHAVTLGVCALAFGVCAAFAIYGVTLAFHFGSDLTERNERGYELIRLISFALFAIAIVARAVGKSWPAALILAGHAAFTLANPVLWAISAPFAAVGLYLVVEPKVPKRPRPPKFDRDHWLSQT